MLNQKNKARIAISFILALLLLLSLCSCIDSSPPAMDTKEAITERMQADLSAPDRLGYTYAADYLARWGFGGYDASKIKWVEQIMGAYYNYEGGLPDTREHARLCATDFLENYYDNVDKENKAELTDAILTCYAMAVADPYTVYRPAQESNDYQTDMSGKFGGIGVVIEYNHDEQSLMISSVYIDSPAEVAGMKVGDYIIGVDGVGIEEIGYLNVVDRVRGKIGTEVRLTLKRGDSTVECTAIRAEVVEKTVAYEIIDNIGYIQITDFKGNTYAQFVEAIDAVEESGAEGVVFDLRSNPGGYLDTVCDMLSYLIPSGHDIVSYAYKNRPNVVIKSEDDKHPVTGEVADHVLDLPMTVICNEYTASAGEIFTAAIRDYRAAGLIKHATIVGKTTYKKGVMQSGLVYNDGSSITLTVAYYKPPCGINYHGIGVSPDIDVDYSQTEDTQLSVALSELEKLIIANKGLQN